MILDKIQRRLLTYLSSFIVISSLVSCDFDEDPVSYVNRDNYFENEIQCITGLNSTYIPLKSIYTYQYMLVTECTTDLMYCASGDQDAQMDVTPARPRFGATMWTQGYLGVRNCNAIIAGIERCAGIDEDTRNRLKAEGVIMRAFYYWFLTSTFGDVPFYTHEIVTHEELAEVAKLPRMSADETRDYLIKELYEYVPYLDQIRAAEVKDNRSGAAFGWMLIAKMAQWNKKWDIAIDALKHIEEIYGDLSQYKIEDNWFRNKNQPETIFEIQHLWQATGIKYNGNLSAMVHPLRDGSNSAATRTMYDGVDIPEWGSTKTTWVGTMRPNAYFCVGLQPEKSGDLRAQTNMAWEYNGIRFKSTGSRPWMGPKFWNPECHLNEDGNNYKVFRYADAILMMAESYFEMDDYASAVKYLNMTRNRAGLEDFQEIGDSPDYQSYKGLQDEIRNERARELVGEFQRKYDLVRWGVWYQQTYDNQDYQRVKDAMMPCHEYYPIPQNEVILSQGILDNKEYEKYGL